MAYELSKIGLAALKQSDRIVVRTDHGKAQVYAIKERRPTDKEPFATDLQHTIDAPVSVYQDWKHDVSEARCFAMMYVYRNQITEVSSILATLRAGDEIRFRFYPDGHSTAAMLDAGFHGDMLQLLVFRGGKQVAEWELDGRVCQNNSARMCKGVRSREAV